MKICRLSDDFGWLNELSFANFLRGDLWSVEGRGDILVNC